METESTETEGQVTEGHHGQQGTVQPGQPPHQGHRQVEEVRDDGQQQEAAQQDCPHCPRICKQRNIDKGFLGKETHIMLMYLIAYDLGAILRILTLKGT